MTVRADEIRDVLITRMEAITPLTSPAITFSQYPRAASVDYDEIVIPNSRVFEVQTGDAVEVGPHGGASIDLSTTFRVVVLYKPWGDIQELEKATTQDRVLIRAALRKEVASEISVLAVRLPEVERTREFWRLTVEGRAQHAEAEWSAT